MSKKVLSAAKYLRVPYRLVPEFVNVANGEKLTNELYAILFKALAAEMPYEVAKARKADPYVWIEAWVKNLREQPKVSLMQRQLTCQSNT